jgi:hypothetical protein
MLQPPRFYLLPQVENINKTKVHMFFQKSTNIISSACDSPITVVMAHVALQSTEIAAAFPTRRLHEADTCNLRSATLSQLTVEKM